MAGKGSPRPKQVLSVTSHEYSLNTPHGEYDLHALVFLSWKHKTPTVMQKVKLPFPTFMEIAFKLLGTDEVKEDAPHLYIDGIRFHGGPVVWGTKILEIRAKINGMAGQYGTPLPLEQRDVLRQGEKNHYGGIDFWYDSSDDTINFAQNTFTLKAIAEVCAIVLRDPFVAIRDKRRYVSWLVGRPSSDFDRMFIQANCVAGPQRVRNWQFNQNAVADSPPANMSLADKVRPIAWSDLEEAAKIQELLHGPPEMSLDVFAVLDTDPMDDEAPKWGMYKTEGGCSVGAVLSDDESRYFPDDEFPEVRFRNFKEFLSFVLEVALSYEFRGTKIPCDLSENTEISRWLPRSTPNKLMLAAMEWAREVMELLPNMDYPHALVCGDSYLETQDDGSLVWRNAGVGMIFSSKQVYDLILLTISDSRTQESPYHYFPHARRAISVRTLSTCTELADVGSTEDSTEEPVVPVNPVAAIVQSAVPEYVVNVAPIEVLVPLTEPEVPEVVELPVAVMQVEKVAPPVVETPLVISDTPLVEGSVATKADQVISDFVRDFQAGASQILANLLS
jgi:hypothetical protein